jgi:hypothetical protein
MHRTQLMIEQWQYEALKAAAERRSVSISELVREILTRHLGPPQRASDGGGLRRIEGIASDGASVARDHDHYLYGKKPKR